MESVVGMVQQGGETSNPASITTLPLSANATPRTVPPSSKFSRDFQTPLSSWLLMVISLWRFKDKKGWRYHRRKQRFLAAFFFSLSEGVLQTNTTPKIRTQKQYDHLGG